LKITSVQALINGKILLIENEFFPVLLSPSCTVRFNPLESTTFWKPGEVKMRIHLFNTDILNDELYESTNNYLTDLREEGHIFLSGDCREV